MNICDGKDDELAMFYRINSDIVRPRPSDDSKKLYNLYLRLHIISSCENQIKIKCIIFHFLRLFKYIRLDKRAYCIFSRSITLLPNYSYIFVIIL